MTYRSASSICLASKLELTACMQATTVKAPESSAGIVERLRNIPPELPIYDMHMCVTDYELSISFSTWKRASVASRPWASSRGSRLS